MDMSLAIAEVNYVAQSTVANISTASATLLLRNVPTAAAITPPMTKSAQGTNEKLQYLN